MKLRPTKSDRPWRDGLPTVLKFCHDGLVHLRQAKYNPGTVRTLCQTLVGGGEKRLRFAETYDPPAGTPECPACAAEWAIQLANYEKRKAR